MPSDRPASPRTAKTGAKSAAAGPGARGSTRAKGARTRARTASGPTRSGAAQGPARVYGPRTSGAFGDYAERAILIPVGAALIARERVVSGVNDTISSYSSSSKARAQLRRFERRGSTARGRLEREVRKTRVRVERELRHRRREIERTVSDLDDRRGAVTRNGTDLANRVQERILGLV
jgi:hypothetical protein